MRIDVNKHWLVYLDFGHAGSLSLQLYLTYHRLLHVRETVNSHALPVHMKNRITSLLCIFETIIRTYSRLIDLLQLHIFRVLVTLLQLHIFRVQQSSLPYLIVLLDSSTNFCEYCCKLLRCSSIPNLKKRSGRC